MSKLPVTIVDVCFSSVSFVSFCFIDGSFKFKTNINLELFYLSLKIIAFYVLAPGPQLLDEIGRVHGGMAVQILSFY